MNPKIRELAEKAGFCFWEDESWGPGEPGIDWSCDYTKEFESFVNLLLDEVLSVVEPKSKEMTNSPYDNGVINGKLLSGITLRKMFHKENW
jgi:hypothetical protein